MKANRHTSWQPNIKQRFKQMIPLKLVTRCRALLDSGIQRCVCTKGVWPTNFTTVDRSSQEQIIYNDWNAKRCTMHENEPRLNKALPHCIAQRHLDLRTNMKTHGTSTMQLFASWRNSTAHPHASVFFSKGPAERWIELQDVVHHCFHMLGPCSYSFLLIARLKRGRSWTHSCLQHNALVLRLARSLDHGNGHVNLGILKDNLWRLCSFACSFAWFSLRLALAPWCLFELLTPKKSLRPASKLPGWRVMKDEGSVAVATNWGIGCFRVFKTKAHCQLAQWGVCATRVARALYWDCW